MELVGLGKRQARNARNKQHFCSYGGSLESLGEKKSKGSNGACSLPGPFALLLPTDKQPLKVERDLRAEDDSSQRGAVCERGSPLFHKHKYLTDLIIVIWSYINLTGKHPINKKRQICCF